MVCCDVMCCQLVQSLCICMQLSEFDWSRSTVSFLYFIATISSATLQSFLGAAVDEHGCRKSMLYMIVFFSVRLQLLPFLISHLIYISQRLLVHSMQWCMIPGCILILSLVAHARTLALPLAVSPQR